MPYFDYPSVPLDLAHMPSDRVSLSPQFLQLDPVISPGVNVGYNNLEQTAGPGECVKYLWHANREVGTACSALLEIFGTIGITDSLAPSSLSPPKPVIMIAFVPWKKTTRNRWLSQHPGSRDVS